MDFYPAPEGRDNANSDHALLACSLWLHVGFIGAAALAVGLLQLFDADANPLSALALAFCGAMLAAASWHRGRIVLEDAEALAVSADALARAARAASSESASRVPSRQVARESVVVLSRTSRQSNRRIDGGRRYPAPE